MIILLYIVFVPQKIVKKNTPPRPRNLHIATCRLKDGTSLITVLVLSPQKLRFCGDPFFVVWKYKPIKRRTAERRCGAHFKLQRPEKLRFQILPLQTQLHLLEQGGDILVQRPF